MTRSSRTPTPRVTLTAVLLLLLSLLALGACTSLSDFPNSTTTTNLPPQSEDARGVIIIVHGANGTADETQERRVREAANDDPRVGRMLKTLEALPTPGTSDLAQSD